MATLARCRTCKILSCFDALAHQGNCDACWDAHCEQLKAERLEESTRNAAQDLLAVCKGLDEAAQQNWSLDMMVYDGLLVDCRNAIAKAEPGQ